MKSKSSSKFVVSERHIKNDSNPGKANNKVRSKEWVADKIREGIEQNTNRLQHGSQYEFFITDEGKFYNRKKETWGVLRNAESVISVHSHSPTNWGEYLPENYQTLNAGDIEVFINAIRKGIIPNLRQMAVIVADGRFDLLEIDIKEENREKLTNLFKLRGIKAIEKELGGWEYGTEEESNEHLRKGLRRFTQKYGLNYYEYLRWNKEDWWKK